MEHFAQMKKAQRHHLDQLQSVRELVADNMSWLSKEDRQGKVRIRLLDLSSILNQEYPLIEKFGPIEEAINYAASGSDMIFEFVEAALNDSGEVNAQPEEEKEKDRQDLLHELGQLQDDLNELPGFVPEGYIPGSPWSYYFLGVTNHGKGLVAYLDESSETESSTTTEQTPF